MLRRCLLVRTPLPAGPLALDAQVGGAVGYPAEGSLAYAGVHVALPILAYELPGIQACRIELLAYQTGALHADGARLQVELGARVRLPYLSIGYTSERSLGARNVSYYRYVDDEQIMRAFVTAMF